MRTSPVWLVASVAIAASTCTSTGADTEASRSPSTHEQGLPAGFVEVEAAGGWARVRVELAVTPQAQARGLMFREELAEGHGMLFIFEEEKARSFWMKNTLVPLDILFIDGAGDIVGIVHEAEPLTTEPRTAPAASRYVLEVPGGWARANGVEAGCRVRFRGASGVAEPFGG